ncbi:hypothetical protein Dimus_015734 [Dionaea muscipula]
MVSGKKKNGASGVDPEFGAIFMSNCSTKKECFRRQLFGLPASAASFVQRVKAGMVLFLFEYEKRELYGVYQACSDGGMDLSPKAFKSSSNRFPAQVRFRVIWLCSPLSENEFHSAIKENYFAARKFNFGLSKDQVRKLVWLCSSKKLRDRLPHRQILTADAGRPVPHEVAISAVEDGIYENEDFVENQLRVDAAINQMYTESPDTSPRSRRVGDCNNFMNAPEEMLTPLAYDGYMIPFVGAGDGEMFHMDDRTWASVTHNLSERTGKDEEYEVSDTMNNHLIGNTTDTCSLSTKYPEASIMKRKVSDRRLSTNIKEDLAPKVVSDDEAAITNMGEAAGGRFLMNDAEYDGCNVSHPDYPLLLSRFPHYQVRRMSCGRELMGDDESESKGNLDDGGRLVGLDVHSKRDIHKSQSSEDDNNLLKSGMLWANYKGFRCNSVLGVDYPMGFPQSKKPCNGRVHAKKSCPSTCLIRSDVRVPNEVCCTDSDDVGQYHHESNAHLYGAEGAGCSQNLDHPRSDKSPLTGGASSSRRTRFPSHPEVNVDSYPYGAPGYRRNEFSQATPGGISHALNSSVSVACSLGEERVRELYKVSDFKGESKVTPPLQRKPFVHGKKHQGVSKDLPAYEMSPIPGYSATDVTYPVIQLNKPHCRRSVIREGSANDARLSIDDDFMKQDVGLKSHIQGHPSELLEGTGSNPRKRRSVFARLNYSSRVDTERVVTHVPRDKSRISKIVDDVMEMLSEHSERVKRVKVTTSENSGGVSQVLREIQLLNLKSRSEAGKFGEEASANAGANNGEVFVDKRRKRRKLVRPVFVETLSSNKSDVVGEELAVLSSASQSTGVDSVNKETNPVKELHQPMDDGKPEVPHDTAFKSLHNKHGTIETCEAMTQNSVKGGQGLPISIGVGIVPTDEDDNDGFNF